MLILKLFNNQNFQTSRSYSVQDMGSTCSSVESFFNSVHSQGSIWHQAWWDSIFQQGFNLLSIIRQMEGDTHVQIIVKNFVLPCNCTRSFIAAGKMLELKFELLLYPRYAFVLAPRVYALASNVKNYIVGPVFENIKKVITFRNKYFEELDVALSI